MATPDYFVGVSVATDDTATFTDRATGLQELAVTLTRTDDGAPDARHPVTLTVDLDVTDDAHVVVRHNGTKVYALSEDAVAELRRASGKLGGPAVSVPDALAAARAVVAELEAQ